MDELNEEQLMILNQYKEILNESDEDIARATLESLEWNLQKAIEASEVTTEVADNPMPHVAHIKEENMPSYEEMELTDSRDITFPRLNPKVIDLEDEEESVPKASSRKNPNRRSPTVDELSLDSRRDMKQSKVSSSAWKPPSSRDDSGSGSTCSLSNPAQASTSAEVVVVGGRGGAGKDCRKEKKRCKMSGRDNDEPITLESEDEEELDDDMDSIVYLSDEDAKKESSPNSSFSDKIPLIPIEFSSILEAMQNFTSVFEARYGSNFASFYQGSLSDAAIEAFEAPGRSAVERRPLAIYLHNDASIATNIFAQTVMCSDQVSSLLKCQFVLWGWDMSQKENRDKLYEWLTAANMLNVGQSVKSIPTTKYPLLIVLVKEHGSIYPLTVIKGHDSIAQTVEKLMTAVDVKMRNDSRAKELIESERIRQEQNDQYEMSLAQDRARKEEQERQREIEKQEQILMERLREEKQKRQMDLAASLPSEPAESDGEAITICVRAPTSGDQSIRRFRRSEPLQLLTTYIESLGFEMDKHVIWNSDFPRQDVGTFDMSKSFAEFNWPRREKLTIEEK